MRCHPTAQTGARLQNDRTQPRQEVSVKPVLPIVLATRNAGKTREIRDLLQGFDVEIKNLDDFGPLPPIEEDGDTFDENAYKKASLTARNLGLPALADDSGLLVDALGGAPGVLSARYAGVQDGSWCQPVEPEYSRL